MPTATKPCADHGSDVVAKNGKPAPAKPATEPCCTGLECFEKPRFFCGQLLTDLDLEAAMSYVAAKNRLHNRYLFGAGAVCGLGVRCDPCNEGSVIVDTGYALDCLGNDIVVCAPKPFDVKGYLDCRKKKQETDCNGMRPRIPADCETPEVQYCLVISYDEKQTKPVNALVRDNGCQANRCEPSRTQEVYRLDLIDEKTAKTLNVQPSVWSRIAACAPAETAKLESYLTELSTLEKTPAARSENLPKVFARLRASVLEYAKRGEMTHCDLVEKVCELDKQVRLASQAPVNPGVEILDGGPSPAAGNGAMAATQSLYALYVRLVIDCWCNAFLMPCGECCDPEYVLLACLTIRDGRVVSICNTVRTQVITGPSVRYWLQPFFDSVGRIMEWLCCRLDVTRTFTEQRATFTGVHERYTQGLAAAKMAKAYSSSLFQNFRTTVTEMPLPPEQRQVVNTLDFYQRPVEDVRADLERVGIKIITINRAATVEEAYSLDNLRQLGLSLNRGANVELVVAPDNMVTGIRVLKDE